MNFDLTSERQTYLQARGKVVLNACPGSGKTTCLVHKLALLSDECLSIYGKHSGIACLSFTNVAKQEILNKYKKANLVELSHPHIVSTIDSFINKWITLPFFNLLYPGTQRPKIVEDDLLLHNIFVTFYMKDGKWAEAIKKSLRIFKNREGKELCNLYPPTSVWINLNGTFTFKGTTPDAKKVDPDIFQQYGNEIFKLKLKAGTFTCLDAAYLAMKILSKHPKIGKWLIKRFPYFIIDEAQDTSEIQHAIFDRLTYLGLTNLELIGDPYQSLYQFRDAMPELFLHKFRNSEWLALTLRQNRRSVQRIIECFSIVRQTKDEGIVSYNVDDKNIPIHIYRYNTSTWNNVISDFESCCSSNGFSDNWIVVRGKDFRKTLLGDFGSIDVWKSDVPGRLLNIRNFFERNQIKKAVEELRKLIFELQNPMLGYSQVYEGLEKLSKNRSYNGLLYHFLYNIPTYTLSFYEWTTETQLQLRETFGIDKPDLFTFKSKLSGKKLKVSPKEMKIFLQRPIKDYYSKPVSEKTRIPITTIHQVKGASLDAILYFFDERSTGESVCFKHFSPSPGFPSEKQRLIYVACSRPKQLLALAFPESITIRELYEKFGPAIHIAN